MFLVPVNITVSNTLIEQSVIDSILLAVIIIYNFYYRSEIVSKFNLKIHFIPSKHASFCTHFTHAASLMAVIDLDLTVA